MVNQKVCNKRIYHGCIMWIENPSLGITIRHHSASIVMPISDPRDRFFYQHHTAKKDAYNLTHVVLLSSGKNHVNLIIDCIGNHVSTSSNDDCFCKADDVMKKGKWRRFMQISR